ncbi:hypothetical protein CVT24_004596 [Panaeolus cyanescens]|uniref:Uncharacterized protein n=1 Tax=Panaeolus cyanescens TaxID=181874 RepID=A0A409YBB6_9AGAR|nr:hypothetical protein CVT24_004596 [Panaeolus cyanescens]
MNTPTNGPSPSCPIELVARIINIYASVNPLDQVKKLSLVSSFFRDECRKHVFRKITIGNDGDESDDERSDYEESDEERDDDFDGRHTSTRNSKTMPSIGDFLELLRRHPHVIPYIQELDVVDPRIKQGELFHLATALSKHPLPKLSELTLRFDEVNYEGWGNDISHFLNAITRIPTLRQLNLAYVDSVFPSTLASFTQLEGISLMNTVLDEQVTEKFNPIMPPPKLKSLHLDFSCSDADELTHFTSLQRMDGAPTLDLSNLAFLNLNFVGVWDVKAFSRLFESQPQEVQSIKSLALTLDMTETTAYSSDFNISKQIKGWILPNFRALTTLHVVYKCVEKTVDLYDGFSGILVNLETNNFLRDLQFQVALGQGFRETAGEGWKRLVDVLMKPGWTHLKEVTLVFDMPHLREIGNEEESYYEQYEDDYSSSPTETPSISAFLRLLHLHPHVACYIQKLDVIHPDEEEIYDLTETLKENKFPVLSVCLLSFRPVDLEGWDGDVSIFLDAVTRIPSLRHLNLDGVNLVSPSIIASCTHLEQLWLTNTLFADGPGPKVFDISTLAPPRLKALSLFSGDYEPLTKLKVDGTPIIDLSRLSQLRVHATGTREVNAFCRLIESQSQELQSVESFVLTISVEREHNLGINLQTQVESCILPNFRSLTRLSITYRLSEETAGLYYRFIGVLANLEGNNVLNDLELDVSIKGGAGNKETAARAWREIVDVLMKPGWTRLKTAFLMFEIGHLEHIFRKIRIGHEDRHKTLSDPLEEDVNDDQKAVPVSRFIQLLSDHPHVARHIRVLRLTKIAWDELPALTDTLKLHTPALTSLSILQFVNVNVAHIAQVPPYKDRVVFSCLHALSQVPSLRRLEVADIGAFPTSLLAAFRQIQYFKCYELIFVDDNSEYISNVPHRKLETLSLSYMRSPIAFAMIAKDGMPVLDVSGLRNLDYDLKWGEEFEELTRLFELRPVKVLESLKLYVALGKFPVAVIDA